MVKRMPQGAARPRPGPGGNNREKEQRCGPKGQGKTECGKTSVASGVIFMMVFVCICASLRIVRPLFVLFVGQICTCTDANDSWLYVSPREHGIVCAVSSNQGPLDTIFICIYARAGNARAPGRAYPWVPLHQGACFLEVWSLGDD